MGATTQLKRNDLLMVVDVQNDFMPGGAFPVKDGDQVVPVINRLADVFRHVILTQDWHPRGHQAFASCHPGRSPYDVVNLSYGDQMLWPDHCIPGTEGAGVADVLFGDHPPTGRLSHSWPRSMAQVPVNFGDPGYDPLYPYGHGLTY